MRFASAVSLEAETDAAIADTVAQLAEALPDGADVAWVFVSMEHADALRRIGRAVSETLGEPLVTGCTCRGVVGVGREYEDGPAISVLAGEMPGVDVELVKLDEVNWSQAADAPRLVLETVRQSDDLRAIIALADPFSTPIVSILPTLNAALPGVPVVGGMASGAARPRGNRILADERIMHEGAVAIALRGDVHVQTTVSQGARPIGSPLVITKAKRHVVQQLGGRVALGALREMVKRLDSSEQQLVQTHGVLVGRVIDEYKPKFGRGDFVIRGLVGVDPKAGYLAIGDPQVRVGQTIQFHVRDGAAAKDDLLLLLEAQRVHGAAAGALLFTCNGRGKTLFSQGDVDASLVADALENAPTAGFFAAGEIGPIGPASYVHGHTASLIVFRPLHPERE